MPPAATAGGSDPCPRASARGSLSVVHTGPVSRRPTRPAVSQSTGRTRGNIPLSGIFCDVFRSRFAISGANGGRPHPEALTAPPAHSVAKSLAERAHARVRTLRTHAMAHLLPDEVWDQVRPILATHTEVNRGRPRVPDRQVLTGVLFILRTRVAWDDLPAELGCGCGTTCWRRLAEWRQDGRWLVVEQLLRTAMPNAADFDWSRAVIDGSTQ